MEWARGMELAYNDPTTADKLIRLFRMPGSANFLVTTEGKSFEKPDTKLSWQLTAPAGPLEDYRLRLVRADGKKLKPVLCVLEREPVLYITEGRDLRRPTSLPRCAFAERGNGHSRAGD